MKVMYNGRKEKRKVMTEGRKERRRGGRKKGYDGRK